MSNNGRRVMNYNENNNIMWKFEISKIYDAHC